MGAPLPPSPPPAGGGSSGSGGKVALIIGGVLLVLVLLAGGVWALTSGGDDDGDDPELLDDAEFASEANDICLDLESDLDELGDSYFEDVDDLDSADFDGFADEANEVADGHFTDLRAITPEGDVDDWLDLVDEWEDVYGEFFQVVEDGGFEPSSRLEGRYDDLVAELEDLGVDCLEDGSMVDDTTEEIEEEPGDEPTSSTGPPSDALVEQNQPTPPPAFDDTSFTQLGEDCYQGDMEACDELYFQSDFDTPEEEYGDRCGGRTEPGEVLCASIEDPTLP